MLFNSLLLLAFPNNRLFMRRLHQHDFHACLFRTSQIHDPALEFRTLGSWTPSDGGGYHVWKLECYAQELLTVGSYISP